jgi:molybdopterin molybdotransferase
VRIVSTGDELVEVGEVPAPHQIRDSNGRMLAALVGETGSRALAVDRAGDRPDLLAHALRTGLGADLLLVTGGVSVGAYDLVARTLGEAGAETLFHGVAMKPGKPVLAARRGATVVVGLPGNPVSAHVAFVVLVAPALRRMLGYRRFATPEVDAVLAAPVAQRPGRETFHLAQFAWRGGRFDAAPIRTTGSGDVLALARSGGLLRVPATVSRLDAGHTVRALVRGFTAAARE